MQWSQLADLRLRQTDMQSRHQREKPAVEGVVESVRGRRQARKHLKRSITVARGSFGQSSKAVSNEAA
jgi:hypothetical protein